MPTPFDPGYGAEPFRTLVEKVPDDTVFPLKDFRTEWGPLVLYGGTFLDTKLPDIPQQDLPAGSPSWMCRNPDFARRTGSDEKVKRVTITVTIPKAFRPA